MDDSGIIPITTDGIQALNPADATHLEALIQLELQPFMAGCTIHRRAPAIVVTHPAFTFLHDANFVYFTTLPPFRTGQLLEPSIERLFERAGVSHRRILVPRHALTPSWKAAFLEAGYRSGGYVLMERKGPPIPTPINEEVTLHPAESPQGQAVLDQIELELLRGVPWNSPMIRATLRTRRREIAPLLDLKCFWSAYRAVPAGSVGLLQRDQMASIQAVSTRPVLRGKRIASSMVLKMLELAERAGCTEVSLMVEWPDGPLRLYRALGFEAVAFLESWVRDG